MWTARRNDEKRQKIKGQSVLFAECVNDHQEDLRRAITEECPLLSEGDFDWKSPLASEKYQEYSDHFLDRLGLSAHTAALRRFWPRNGPHWDGLAKVHTPQGDVVLLIEAKAHPGENGSTCRATAKSKIQIAEAFQEVLTYMGIKHPVNAVDDAWFRWSYQLANRIAFLYFLHVKCKVPTYLVLLNFVNDITHVQTAEHEWKRQSLLNPLGLQADTKLIDRILTVYLDASKITQPHSNLV